MTAIGTPVLSTYTPSHLDSTIQEAQRCLDTVDTRLAPFKRISPEENRNIGQTVIQDIENRVADVLQETENISLENTLRMKGSFIQLKNHITQVNAEIWKKSSWWERVKWYLSFLFTSSIRLINPKIVSSIVEAVQFQNAKLKWKNNWLKDLDDKIPIRTNNENESIARLANVAQNFGSQAAGTCSLLLPYGPESKTFQLLYISPRGEVASISLKRTREGLKTVEDGEEFPNLKTLMLSLCPGSEIHSLQAREKQLKTAQSIRDSMRFSPSQDAQATSMLEDRELTQLHPGSLYFLITPTPNPLVFSIHQHASDGTPKKYAVTVLPNGILSLNEPQRTFSHFEQLREALNLGDPAHTTLIQHAENALMPFIHQNQLVRYPNRDAAIAVMRTRLTNLNQRYSLAQKADTFFLWKDQSENLRFLAKKKDGTFHDFLVDTTSHPGKILLRRSPDSPPGLEILREWGARDAELLITQEFGDPLHAFEGNIATYQQHATLYAMVQSQVARSQEILADNPKAGFGILKSKVAEKFEQLSRDEPAHLIVIDKDPPHRANFTLFTHSPSAGTQAYGIRIDTAGRVALHLLDAQGGTSPSASSTFENIRALQNHLLARHQMSLASLIQTRLVPLEQELQRDAERLGEIQSNIRAYVTHWPYDKAILSEMKQDLERLLTRVKACATRHGCLWRIPGVEKAIKLEISTIDIRIQILDASQEFERAITATGRRSIKTYEAFERAKDARLPSLFNSALESTKSNMSKDELRRIRDANQYICGIFANRFFPNFVHTQIPALASEIENKYSSCNNVRELIRLQNLVDHALIMLRWIGKSNPDKEPIITTQKNRLERLKTRIEEQITTLRRQVSTQPSTGSRIVQNTTVERDATLICGDNNHILNIYHGAQMNPDLTATANAASSIPSIFKNPLNLALMAGQAFLLSSTTGIGFGAAVATTILPRVASAATNLLLPTLDPATSIQFQQFLSLGTMILFNQYGLPALQGLSAPNQAVQPQAAAQPQATPNTLPRAAPERPAQLMTPARRNPFLEYESPPAVVPPQVPLAEAQAVVAEAGESWLSGNWGIVERLNTMSRRAQVGCIAGYYATGIATSVGAVPVALVTGPLTAVSCGIAAASGALAALGSGDASGLISSVNLAMTARSQAQAATQTAAATNAVATNGLNQQTMPMQQAPAVGTAFPARQGATTPTPLLHNAPPRPQYVYNTLTRR